MTVETPDSRLRCPHCGSTELERIPRHLLDRVISVLLPRRRYRCRALGCGWEGTLRARRDAGSSASRRYDGRIDGP